MLHYYCICLPTFVLAIPNTRELLVPLWGSMLGDCVKCDRIRSREVPVNRFIADVGLDPIDSENHPPHWPALAHATEHPP